MPTKSVLSHIVRAAWITPILYLVSFSIMHYNGVINGDYAAALVAALIAPTLPFSVWFVVEFLTALSVAAICYGATQVWFFHNAFPFTQPWIAATRSWLGSIGTYLLSLIV